MRVSIFHVSAITARNQDISYTLKTRRYVKKPLVSRAGEKLIRIFFTLVLYIQAIHAVR